MQRINLLAWIIVLVLSFAVSIPANPISPGPQPAVVVYLDSRTTDLPTAVAAASAANTTLILGPGTWPLAAILTIPQNIILKVDRGALIFLANGATLTINGGLEGGRYQIFAWTGTGRVRFGLGAVAEVFPEWWGAVANGTIDCSAAIQAAIDARGPVGSGSESRCPVIRFGAGDYKLNTALNLTNTRAPGTIQRDGVHLCGTGYLNGTHLVGNTGNLVIDACGAAHLRITDLTIDTTVAGLSNPSVVGILCAPLKTLPQAQFHHYKNLTIVMHDAPAANGGVGTVALANFGGEDHTYDTCYFNANIPVTLTTEKTFIWGIDSVYQSGNLPASHSLTSVNFIGNNVLITVNRRSPAMTICGVTTLNFSGDLFNIGAGGTNDVAIAVHVTVNGFNFNGVVESFGTFWQLAAGIQNAQVRCSLSNPLNSSAPVMLLDPAYGIITNSDLNFYLGNNTNRQLLSLIGPPAGNVQVASYLANTTIKTNQTKSYLGLNQNLLYGGYPATGARTRNVKVQGTDFSFEVGYQSQEILIPPTTVGTVGGSPGATVCKITMPAVVAGRAAGSLSLTLDGTLHLLNYSSPGAVTKAFRAVLNVATLNTDGTITMSGGGTADLYDNSTVSAVNSGYVNITPVIVTGTAAGTREVDIKVDPTLTGTGNGEIVQFVGKATMLWGNFYAQAPLLSLP